MQILQKKTNLKKDDHIVHEKSSTEFLLLLHWKCKGAEAEVKKIHKVFEKTFAQNLIIQIEIKTHNQLCGDMVLSCSMELKYWTPWFQPKF